MTPRLTSGHFFGELHGSVRIESGRLSKTFYRKGERQPPHTHERPHLCLTAHGTYQEVIGKKTWTFSRGVLTYYHPEQVHSDIHFTDGIHFVIEIETKAGSFLETLLPQFIREPVDSGNALSLAWRLYDEFHVMDRFSPLAMEALTLELMLESFRKKDSPDPARRPVWLNAVVEILRSVPKPSLVEIARQVQIHPIHLAKTFRRFEGVTMGEYIRRLRVEMAQRRLSRTRDPIVAIALECGFADQTHFSRVFKRISGVTPAQYRRMTQR